MTYKQNVRHTIRIETVYDWEKNISTNIFALIFSTFEKNYNAWL